VAVVRNLLRKPEGLCPVVVIMSDERQHFADAVAMVAQITHHERAA